MKKAWGGFVKGFAKFLDGFFGFLIAFIETLVNLTVGFRYVLGSILSFGCIFILFFPYIFFRYKWVTFTVLFITIFPILGKGFVNYLNTSSTNKKKKEKRVKNDKDVNKKNGLEDLTNGLIKTDLDSMILDITNNKVNTVDITKVMVNKDMDIKTNTKIQWTIS